MKKRYLSVGGGGLSLVDLFLKSSAVHSQRSKGITNAWSTWSMLLLYSQGFKTVDGLEKRWNTSLKILADDVFQRQANLRDSKSHCNL